MLNSLPVFNESPSTITKNLYEDLKNTKGFNIVDMTEENYNEKLSNREVVAVVRINKGFTEDIIKGKKIETDVYSLRGKEVTVWVNMYLDNYIWNLNSIGKVASGDEKTFLKLYDSFRQKEIELKTIEVKDAFRDKGASTMSVGILIMLILMTGTATTSIILKERTDKTFYRVLCSPLRLRSYIGGNVIGSMGINSIRLILFIITAIYVMKINLGMSGFSLFIILNAFGFVSTAMGIFIVSVSKNTIQASVIANLIITPTCMLSGCFWPVTFMPDFMQRLAYFFPQTWTLKAVIAMQGGGSFISIIPNLLLVSLFALALFLVGVYILKTKEETFRAE